MFAIETYFMGPTNYRGARIKARVMEGQRDGKPARSLTLPWDHAKGPVANHTAAAQALATQLGWAGEWAEGSGPEGSSIGVRCKAPWGGTDFFTVEEAGA